MIGACRTQPRGERADVSFVSLDGRHLSGRSSTGEWLEWTCAG
ncbi:hypothetical protein [Dactylosporangium sp. CA-092794]